MNYPTEWPYFFTATIQEWNPCLQDDRCKDIIVDCLQTMVAKKQINLNAFVIMSNHVHIIWKPLSGLSATKIHSSFTTYTGKQITNWLKINNTNLLEKLKSKNLNREYNIWKRRALSVELFTEAVFLQKLEYIHLNPVRAGLIKYGADYYYSSAAFYEKGVDPFNMITHYSGN